MTELCISFEESLQELILGDVTGAYGLIDADRCDYVWAVYQREGWIRKLLSAQTEVERDLGRPLCSRELCDEIYAADDEIYLRNRPVAYLGEKVWSDWTEVALTFDHAGTPTEGYIEIPAAGLSSVGLDGLDWDYPGSVLDIYHGLQELQAPQVSEPVAGTYRFTWPAHHLVDPLEDSVSADASDLINSLIPAVQWRTYTIDATNAVTALTACSCGSCDSEPPTYAATLCDAQTGKVCLERTGGCASYSGQVRIAYATGSYCDEDGLDPALREAVVLLALHKAKHTPSKPCGCDNSFVDDMLTTDKTILPTDRSEMLRYGTTAAAMQAWRTVMKYKERPRITAPVASAGMLTARRVRKASRWY